jgi:hypothetical protein
MQSTLFRGQVSDCHAASTLRRERESRRACSCRVPAQWRAKPVRLSHLVAPSRAPYRSERPRECCCSMLQRCWFAFPCCATVLKSKHLRRADRRTTSRQARLEASATAPVGQRPRRLGGLSRAGTRRLPRRPRRMRRGAGPGCRAAPRTGRPAAPARGPVTAAAAPHGRRRGGTLQTGQMEWSASQRSMHGRWNWCRHGRIRASSAGARLSRQMAHVSGSPPLAPSTVSATRTCASPCELPERAAGSGRARPSRPGCSSESDVTLNPSMLLDVAGRARPCSTAGAR